MCGCKILKGDVIYTYKITIYMEDMSMRKNFGAKHYMYPQPVLIIAAYGEDGTANAMNAAWGGISSDTQISMCLSPGHKTVKNILKRKAFTVSMADATHVAACDYLGLESGNQVPNKLEQAGIAYCDGLKLK